MGREIRRVPIGWEHPKENNYNPYTDTVTSDYVALYDGSFEAEAQEWLDGCVEWVAGKHKDFAEDSWARGYHAKKFEETGDEYHLPENFLAKTYVRFCEFRGNFPNPDDYRPDWPERDMVAYQIYETVSEGTPVSPVFLTHAEMKRWLFSQGHSEVAVSKFIEYGSAPSMIMFGGPGGVSLKSNIDALEDL